MKKKTGALILAAVVAVGAGGYGVSRLLVQGTDSNSETIVPVISVSELQSEANSVGSKYNGIVDTQKKKNITLDSEKDIEQILVSEGDSVLENDALFTYSTEKTRLEISQKELDKEKQNNTISGLRENINQMNAELAKGNLSSTDRMDLTAQIMESQTQIAQAEYDLKVADSEIAALNAEIKNSTVRAPMAGTIETMNDPDTLTDSNTPFITIVADGDFRIKGTISEQNEGKVVEGMSMLIRSRIDDQTWTGTVTSLESTQEEKKESDFSDDTSESASQYSFYVALDTTDDLMLGQHVILEHIYEEMDGLALSNGYLNYDEEGNAFVYAVEEPGNKLEIRMVETGEIYEDRDMIQILSGITEDDYVAWPDMDCAEGAETSFRSFVDGEE
ncbi:MAG: efflux RND transporter periplasmic adaptor subunit [Lachnospiraceae bacterium]|nr:efflux RND transporter periplasmic adaptor subunit [Lachnospiraceae bacterium]